MGGILAMDEVLNGFPKDRVVGRPFIMPQGLVLEPAPQPVFVERCTHCRRKHKPDAEVCKGCGAVL